jgi:hypothetical protein
MTPPISCPDRGLATRRSIVISAMAASLLCAPAIVRPASLMPARRLPFPYGPQYAGFLERLYFHSLEAHLRSLRHGVCAGARIFATVHLHLPQ